MSIKVATWVWDNSPYTGTKLLIHLALADWAGDHGICWPKQETIASKCRCSVETVRTCIKEMQSDGYIEIIEASKGRGSSHKYRLKSPKFSGVSAESPKDDIETPQIWDETTPNPSPNNHQEPLIKPSVDERPRCPYCKLRYTFGKPHNCSAMNMLMR